MQPALDTDILDKFPAQIRGMVANMYSAESIRYNDLVVLATAFAEETEPRYNTSVAAIAGVLGQMAIFEWAIAAGYKYHQADFIRAAEARAEDLSVLVAKISPTVQHIIPLSYPESPPCPAYNRPSVFSSRNKYRGRRNSPPYTPYYGVYSHDREFYGIDDDPVLFGESTSGNTPSNAEIIQLAKQYARAGEC